jgi:hypothetical protein
MFRRNILPPFWASSKLNVDTIRSPKTLVYNRPDYMSLDLQRNKMRVITDKKTPGNNLRCPMSIRHYRLTRRRFVDRHRCFGEMYCLHFELLLNWTWTQHVPPKRWLPTFQATCLHISNECNLKVYQRCTQKRNLICRESQSWRHDLRTMSANKSILTRILLYKKTLWPESASELYRPREDRLSAKLVPTAVSLTYPYSNILDFLDRNIVI